MDSIFPPPSTQPSPVTWHVALWVLFTLAISSMAQPGGNLYSISSFKRYRMYFCSSPIFCVTDALSMLTRLPWTSLALHVSPVKAARLVLIERDCERELGQNSWPRWIFFVIGTLPAGIKLCSFSGLPWTQAWGLMFALSFLILEGFVLLSKLGSAPLASSIEEELGYTSITWRLEENNDLRNMTKHLFFNQKGIDIVCFILALRGHVVLSVWTIEDIWLSASFFIQVEPIVSDTAEWINIAIDFILSITLIFGLFVFLSGSKDFLSRWLSAKKFVFMVFLQNFISLLTRRLKQGSGKTVERWNSAITILVVISGILYALKKIFIFVCIRFPALGRIMLLTTARYTSVVRKDESQPDAAAGSGTERKSIVKILLYEVETGVKGLLFFCCNAILCILWYALRYDPSGTINPAWTDIFG